VRRELEVKVYTSVDVVFRASYAPQLEKNTYGLTWLVATTVKLIQCIYLGHC
jgi:hypothetical protein